MTRLSLSSPLGAALLVGLSALALAGCAAGYGWPALLVMLLSTGGLALTGCGSSHDRGEARVDAGGDGGGFWESCCVDGVIDTCYCPPMTACNYGWYTDCGGGTCAFEPEACYPDGGGPDAGPVDAGPADAGADAGGTWESCCVDGVIDTCYCPPGAECNYGWYTDCGGGTCAFTPDECGPDGGVEDGSVTFLDAGSAP